jgi:hypothetical protein
MAQLKWKTGELFKQLDEIKKRTTREMAGAAKDVIDRFHNKMVHERLSIHGPTSLGARTGKLKDALKGEVKIKKNQILGRVYFKGRKANMIANVHEGKRGKKHTLIKPKGDWLKVPLPSALTPTGRIKARFKGGKKKGQFIRRSKAGNLIIFERVSKKKILPVFVLKKQVKIPKRLFMMLTWKKFRKDARKILKAAQRRAYRRTG